MPVVWRLYISQQVRVTSAPVLSSHSLCSSPEASDAPNANIPPAKHTYSTRAPVSHVMPLHKLARYQVVHLVNKIRAHPLGNINEP